MKVTVVYSDKQKRVQRPEFTGTHAKLEAFQFIYNMQPITVIAIRIEA